MFTKNIYSLECSVLICPLNHIVSTVHPRIREKRGSYIYKTSVLGRKSVIDGEIILLWNREIPPEFFFDSYVCRRKKSTSLTD